MARHSWSVPVIDRHTVTALARHSPTVTGLPSQRHSVTAQASHSPGPPSQINSIQIFDILD